MEKKTKISSLWVIPSDMHGVRVDQYLARSIGRISRTRAQRIIWACDFLLDGRSVRPSNRVRAGQKAELKRVAPDHMNDIDHFAVGIVFENDDFLVVNKPAGLSIHPSANCLYKTLTHWLRIHYPGTKINPCHRIDKETSGIVVCAKTRKTESAIKKSFMHNRVKKTYLAVVKGMMTKKTVIDIPLGLQRERGLVAIRMIEDREGKHALTLVKPLLCLKESMRSLVLCHPKTGRQHQIRAHLSLIGHPLLGDKLYGQPDEFFDRLTRGFSDGQKKLAHHRHALHAARIKLQLFEKTWIFRCAPPADFLSLIAKR